MAVIYDDGARLQVEVRALLDRSEWVALQVQRDARPREISGFGDDTPRWIAGPTRTTVTIEIVERAGAPAPALPAQVQWTRAVVLPDEKENPS